MMIGCKVRDLLHIYCPGCGGRRAIKSLLELDIFKSLYYNPMAIIIILLIIINVYCMFCIFNKSNMSKYSSFQYKTNKYVLIFMIIYFLVRNILLIFFKIDFLGDFEKI